MRPGDGFMSTLAELPRRLCSRGDRNTKRSVGLSLLLLCAALPGSTEKTRPAAVVLSVVGHLEIKPSNPGAWRPALVGSQVNAEDTLRTGEFGKATIKYIMDGTVIKIAPNTELVVRRYDEKGAAGEKKWSGSLLMRGGDIWGHVNPLKKQGDFQIETKTAVAAVKGTTLGCQDQLHETTLIVYEGAVEFANQFGKQMVEAKLAGQATYSVAKKDAPPSKPLVSNQPQNLQGWTQAMEAKANLKLQFNRVHPAGKPFPIAVSAVDLKGALESGRADTVKLSSSSPSMEFSSDQGAWAPTLALALKGGRGDCYGRDKTLGSCMITATGQDLTPKTEDIALAPEQRTTGKDLIIRVKTKDGKEETIILKYKK